MRQREFRVGRGEGYPFLVDPSGGISAVPRADGTCPVIGGQLDLSGDVRAPDDWSPVEEATGNNARISDGVELYAGAGFGDPLIEGQVEDALWGFGSALPPSGRLLELGCGPGFLLAAIGERLTGWSLTGVDPSPHSVEQAVEKGIDCHLGFLDDVTLEPGFDAIVVMGNFQLHPDPGATLRGLAALAASGGRLYLDSKNPRSTTRRLARQLMVTPGLRDVGAVNAFAAHAFHGLRNAYTKEQLAALLEESGWVVDRIRTTAPRLLRFGNTHDLSQGVKGRLWRALDGVDGLIDQRGWIQVGARRA
jgi:SAM-dependent methyltransferase